MKPLVYLNIKKVDILHHITENLFTSEETNSIFDELTSLIINLTSSRHSKKLTIEILNSLEKYQGKKRDLVQYWLINAINHDDSFVYAYDFLSPIVNNKFKMVLFQPKHISEISLFKMLEDENYLMDKESPLIFDLELLKSFYLAFKNDFWESVKFEYFKNWFRVNPIGTEEFKKLIKEDVESYLCYALGKIENERDKTKCPNFGKWISPLISCYGTLKGRLVKKAKDAKNKNKKIKEIDEKTSLFLPK